MTLGDVNQNLEGIPDFQGRFEEDRNNEEVQQGKTANNRTITLRTVCSRGRQIGAIFAAIFTLGLALIKKSVREAFLGRKIVEINLPEFFDDIYEMITKMPVAQLKDLAIPLMLEFMKNNPQEFKMKGKPTLRDAEKQINKDLKQGIPTKMPDWIVYELERKVAAATSPKKPEDFDNGN